MEWETAMKLALAEAAVAADVSGDVPVGAVLLGPDGEVLALGRNEREALKDPSAHAEIVALRKAAADLNDWRLEECTLVVTLEPCVMCAGLLVHARIKRLVFATRDFKTGAAGSVFNVLQGHPLNHRVVIDEGIMQLECARLLSDFFRIF